MQAYTHELEIKVSRLEEENEKLRRLKVKDHLSFHLISFIYLFSGFFNLIIIAGGGEDPAK